MCRGVPGEGAGESQRRQNARSLVRAAGCSVTPRVWARWMQKDAASSARQPPSGFPVRRRPLGLGEGVREVGSWIAACGRPGGGESRPGALLRGLGWRSDIRPLRTAQRGRGRRESGQLHLPLPCRCAAHSTSDTHGEFDADMSGQGEGNKRQSARGHSANAHAHAPRTA